MVKTSFQVKRKKKKLAIVLTLFKCFPLFAFSYWLLWNLGSPILQKMVFSPETSYLQKYFH